MGNGPSAADQINKMKADAKAAADKAAADKAAADSHPAPASAASTDSVPAAVGTSGSGVPAGMYCPACPVCPTK